MSDELSRSIPSAVSQAVQRAVDEALSRLPSQGVTSTSSSSTSISTSSSNSNSQEVRLVLQLLGWPTNSHCVRLESRVLFNTEIWPFSFFISYCSV